MLLCHRKWLGDIRDITVHLHQLGSIRLNMVIQWSIVDLRISEDILLLEKQVWRERRFNRILTSIWIGISCLLVANFIGIISQTTELVLRMHNHSLTDNLICKNGFHSHHDSRVFSFIFFYGRISNNNRLSLPLNPLHRLWDSVPCVYYYGGYSKGKLVTERISI